MPRGEEVRISRTGVSYLLNGNKRPPQADRNDFGYWETTSPGYFFLVIGDNPTTIYVCPGSRRFMNHSRNDNAQLAKGLKREEVAIDQLNVVIVYGYVQHAGATRKRDYALRYHTFTIPYGRALKDPIAFAYEDISRPEAVETSSYRRSRKQHPEPLAEVNVAGEKRLVNR